MRIEATGKPEGCKLIRISADLEDGVIQSISIRGDFFASPVEGFDRAEKRLRDVPVRELGSRFEQYLQEEGVEAQGINGEGLDRVFDSI
ncbi:hypothetical protein [Treponema primitia]|uniref:hypothetical protein n=1 Tax=Treponema primitia TaxID=88058 RepID=UPI0002E6AFDB|nr:hypothetical protein [Treponema primitia]